MNGLNIYFSDFFNVDEDIIDTYGGSQCFSENDMPIFTEYTFTLQ